MILAFCNCLNIKINTSEIKPISDEYGKLKSSYRAASNNDCLEFFKTALGTFKEEELNVFVGEPTLIQNVIVNKWTIQRCMNCDSFVYGYTRAGEYLLNGNLVRDEKKLFEMESCDNFSMPFKIILRQVDSFGTAGGIGNDPRIKQMHQKLEDYISNETAKTEREIQLFTEQKLTELNNKRERAAKDYAMLANIIKSLSLQQLVTIDCNNSTNFDSLNITTNDDTISTTDMTDATAVSSTSDNNIVDTPPTTPDSTPMSLDISPSSTTTTTTNMKPQIPQNSSSHRKIMKDLSAKHSNVLQSQLQHTMKPIDFDEMFDMDGMITHAAAPTNITNGHPIHISSHKGQSVKFADVDYYPSDDEPVVIDKRSGPLKIPRSGKQNGVNLAKSAPIEIMGPLRYEIDLEDEPENNIDIAASIKALAKSVHGDAVFGDLPTRPRFSTQI